MSIMEIDTASLPPASMASDKPSPVSRITCPQHKRHRALETQIAHNGVVS